MSEKALGKFKKPPEIPVAHPPTAAVAQKDPYEGVVVKSEASTSSSTHTQTSGQPVIQSRIEKVDIRRKPSLYNAILWLRHHDTYPQIELTLDPKCDFAWIIEKILKAPLSNIHPDFRFKDNWNEVGIYADEDPKDQRISFWLINVCTLRKTRASVDKRTDRLHIIGHDKIKTEVIILAGTSKSLPTPNHRIRSDTVAVAYDKMGNRHLPGSHSLQVKNPKKRYFSEYR